MQDMENRIRVIRSKRKTLCIQVRSPEEVLVRCPRELPDRELFRLIQSREDWIRKALAKQQKQSRLPPFTRRELEERKAAAAQDLPRRVARFGTAMGVTWGKITVRSQKSRWGSCSAQGNLSFNCLLMDTPPEVRDYVVVHELCHRKQMNHTPAFWAEVEAVLPDYRQQREWLRRRGGELIERLEK